MNRQLPDALELQLCHMWQEVITTSTVGPNDNFFDLGGDSLLLLRLSGLVTERTGRVVSPAMIMTNPTPRSLARVLRDQPCHGSPSSLVFMHPSAGKNATFFFCVHAASGMVFRYVRLARLLGPSSPLVGVQAKGLFDLTLLHRGIPTMAASYVAELREAQPHGPYYLGGYSMGGIIAYEMAIQLLAAGHTVARLVLFDTSVAPDRSGEESLAPFDILLAGIFGVGSQDFVELQERSTRELSRVVERGHQRGVLPTGYQPADLKQILTVIEANIGALDAYQLPTYEDSIVLLRSSEEPGPLDRGWGKFATGGVRVYDVPGDHHGLFDEPCVGAVARRLKMLLP